MSEGDSTGTDRDETRSDARVPAIRRQSIGTAAFVLVGSRTTTHAIGVLAFRSLAVVALIGAGPNHALARTVERGAIRRDSIAATLAACSVGAAVLSV